MEYDDILPPQPDDRISIPLMMIRGNLELLLDGKLECEGVSLIWYGPGGVVLQFHFADEQRAAAIEKGFQFKAVEE